MALFGPVVPYQLICLSLGQAKLQIDSWKASIFSFRLFNSDGDDSGRIRIECSDRSTTLTILGAKLSDAGKYRLELASPKGTDSAVTTISVN